MEGRVPRGEHIQRASFILPRVPSGGFTPLEGYFFPSPCTKEDPSPGFKSALAGVACATFRQCFGIQLVHSLKWESDCRLRQSSTKCNPPPPIPHAQNHLVCGLQANLCWLQPQALCVSYCSV